MHCADAWPAGSSPYARKQKILLHIKNTRASRSVRNDKVLGDKKPTILDAYSETKENPPCLYGMSSKHSNGHAKCLAIDNKVF